MIGATACAAADDDMPLWERVAFASDIVVGRFVDKVPPRSEWTEREKQNGLVRKLRVNATLKGLAKPDDRIDVEIVDYLSDEPFRVLSSNETLLLFLQKEVVLDEGRTEYGLINPADDGVVRSSAQMQADVAAQVREQQKLLDDYPKWSASLRAKLPITMANLGDRLLQPKTRERAVADILDLPESELWILLVLMDDRRRFEDNLVFLGREHLSHQMTRPERLVELFCEAMDRRLGPIHINMRSCVTDEKRQFAINSWRIYLYHRFVKAQPKEKKSDG